MSDNKPDHKVSSSQGEAIIALLSLTRSEYGRVDTCIGNKTAVGLALTIKRIFDEPDFGKEIVKDAHHGN